MINIYHHYNDIDGDEAISGRLRKHFRKHVFDLYGVQTLGGYQDKIPPDKTPRTKPPGQNPPRTKSLLGQNPP